MAETIRIMLADDHAVVRMGFRLLIQSHPHLEVCAEVDNGDDAIRRYEEILPHILLLDISMPGPGAPEVINRILARHPQANILILSAHEDSAHPRRMMAAGARGYLCKRSAAEELIDAITAVAQGKTWMDRQLAVVLEQEQEGGDPTRELSEREFEVFLMLARGQSVNAIAEVLHVSPRTIGTHLYNIKQKLSAANQAELTLIALNHHLIQP
jgi:two-component system invasion response regulator UvrY